MSINGLNSLQLIGLAKSTVDRDNEYRGFNSDSGVKSNRSVEVNKSAKMVQQEINGIKSNVANVINVFDLHSKSIGTPINVPIMNPLVGAKTYKRELGFDPVKINATEDLFRLNGYGREDLARYKTRMENISKGKGSIYSFDIETAGVNKILNPGAPSINTNNYAITEVSMWKATFDTDANEWKKERVMSFFSSPESSDFKYQQILKNESADSDTGVLLDRIAGYSGKDSVVYNPKTKKYEVNKWAKNTDVTSKQNILNGIENMNKLNSRGSVENIADMNAFVDNMIVAMKEDNSILTTVNGLSFDIPQILAEANYLGVEESKVNELVGLLDENHFDVQKIRSQVGSKKTYEKARELRGKGVDVTDSMALENRTVINTHGNEAIGKEIRKTFNLASGESIAHTADYDTFVTLLESISAYEDSKDELSIFENVSMKPMEMTENSALIANGNFVADKSSLHFKIEDGRVNSYNPSILTRDSAYNLKVSQIKSIDEINNIVKEDKALSKTIGGVGKSFDDLSGKYMIELEDIDDSKNKVLMFYDDIKGFQDDMIDSGLLSPIEVNDYNKWLIRGSKQYNDLDSARRDLEGYGSVTSWKKADRLEEYVDQYKDLQSFTVEDVNGTRKLTNKEKGRILEGKSVSVNGNEYNADSVLTRLSNNVVDNGQHTTRVSSEKLKSFKMAYSDLEDNADLYSNILDETRKNVNGKYINTHNGNTTFDEQLNKNLNDDITVTFGGTIDQLEQEVLNSKTESEKLRYIIENDQELSDAYNEKLNYAKRKKAGKKSKHQSIEEYESIVEDKVINPDHQEKLMKASYRQKYREDFNIDSKNVNALLRDSEELLNRNVNSSLDIITPDGEYTSLRFRDERNYVEDLKRNIYVRVNDEYGDHAASTRDRLTYADDIARDLQNRGLLNEDDLEHVLNSDTVQSKGTVMSEKLFNNKKEAEKIILTSIEDVKGINTVEDALLSGRVGLSNLYNPDIINDELFYKAAPFVENTSMQPKWYRDKRSIMGVPLSDAVKELNGVSVNNVVSNQAKKNASKFTIIGNLSYSNAQGAISESLGDMYTDLGWEKEHISAFNDIFSSRHLNGEVKVKGSNKKQGLTKFVVNDGKDYHLLISTNEKLTRRRLAKGESIEEIAKSVATFKLPKIEESFGTKMVSQSDIAKKALTKSIVPVQVNKSVEYRVLDTAQEVLMGIKDSLPYVKERIGDKDYVNANKRLSRAWKNINESKSLTATSYKYVEKDGHLALDLVYGMNRADAAKADLINHTGIVYELDTLLNNSKSLNDKFMDLYSINGSDDEYVRLKKRLGSITRSVADHDGKGRVKYIKHMTELGTDGTKLNVFINNNIQEIAKALVEDKSFTTGRGKDIVWYLEQMLEKGNVAVINKPSDAVKGYVNPTGLADYVPHSNISNTARETMIQGMNGHSIYEDSITAAYNYRLKDVLGEAKDPDDIYNKLNIKRNFGVTTPKTLSLSNEFYKKNKGTLAISTKVKHMTSKEMNDKLVNIYNNSDNLHETIQKIIFKKYNIKASNEEIKEAAKLVSASSSLYEDSAMMNVMFADIVNPIAATNQKVYKPKDNLKIGMTVNSGDVIGHDVHGKPIRANDSATIKNIENGRMIFQLEENNLSIKGNFNHSEKAVMIAPSYKTGNKATDERMKKILSGVQYGVTGEDVNIALNAGVKKHDALNTVLISNEMAISNAITNDSEAEIVRKAFKTHAPNLDIDIAYDDVRKGYVTVNTPRLTQLNGVDPIAEFDAVVDSLKSDGKLGGRISENMKALKDDKTAYMDVVFASNNTVERGMNALGEGSGTSISTRGFVIKGTYRELDKELISQYNDGTFFKALIEGDSKKILNANKDGAREVANIYSALDAMYNESPMEYVNVKKRPLKDVITPNGLIETDKLDELFKFDNKTNLFELDLSEFGISIDNPFFVKNAGELSEVQKQNLKKHSEKLSKIYMPSTMPNVQGKEGATVSKLQKSQVDLLRKIQDAKYLQDLHGKSASERYELLKTSAEDYIDALMFELTDNDGKRYQIQKTKDNIGSFRAEMHKVVAPLTDENGMMEDLAFGNRITAIKDGHVKYTKSTFVNEDDLRKLGVNFDILGEDILSKQVSNTDDQLDFLKSFMNEKNIDINNAKNLEEAQEIIKANHRGSFSNDELASRYFREIGFEGEISRDPIIRIESESGTIIRTSSGVNKGGVSIDPITAQGLKADSDGDKLNIMLKSFSADNEGNLVLRGYNDAQRVTLRNDAIGSSTSNMARLGALKSSLEKSTKENKNMFDLSDYKTYSNLDEMMKDASSGKDISYFTNSTAKQITTNALLSKDIVGQTSNPGLYIRAASLEVAHDLNKVDSKIALAFDKSISIGTLVVEQNSIDQKLNKFGGKVAKDSTDKLFNAMDMGNRWRTLHDAVRSGNEDSLRKSLTSVIEMIKPYATEDEGSKYIAMKWQNTKAPQDAEDVSKIIDNILSGNVKRNKESYTVNVEEFLSDVLTVFKDDKASNLYTSAFVARSSGALNGVNSNIHDEMLKLKALTEGADEYENIASAVAMKQMNLKSNLSDTISVGGVELENGAKIAIAGQGGHIEQGIYGVTLNGQKDGKHSLTLTGENGTALISRDNVFDINKELSQREAFVISENEIGKYEDILFKNYKGGIENSMISSHGAFNGHISNYEDIIKNGGPTTVKEKAIVSAVESYNIDNLRDMHKTIDVLSDKNYVLDDRADMIKQMNDAIRAKGTKEYQAKKKEIIMGQKGIQQYSISNYDKFMGDISKAASEIGPADFSGVKETLSENKRININSIRNSEELTDFVMQNIKESGREFQGKELEEVIVNSKRQVLGHFESVDEGIFKNINEVYKKHQHDASFRREVLGWELDNVDELLIKGEKSQAINKMNDMTMIFSTDYSGKKLGEMSLNELKDVAQMTGNTGIDDAIVKENIDIINKLITLRENDDIMLESISDPIIDNFADNIGKDTIDQINKDIKEKGKTRRNQVNKSNNKSTLSSLSDKLSGVKSKISGLSTKKKIAIGAMAAAGVGATMMLGNNVSNGKSKLNNRNQETESNLNNGSLPKAPPSQKRVYVSDNNAINVNVRGRAPMNSSPDSAERAISTLFGQKVSVNSNIRDSRETIHDRDVDEMMDKAIR